MYILLSSEETLYEVKTSALSRPGIATVVTAELHHKIRRSLPELVVNEQKAYVTTAAEAAYSSLNPLDWIQGFHAEVRLIPNNGKSVSFDPESNSAGLGYALALALEWRHQLNKGDSIDHEVFATGQIHASGSVTGIGHLPTKITAACSHMESLQQGDKIPQPFYIFFPKANLNEVTEELATRVTNLGGKLVPVTRLSQALSLLLGDAYDGKDGNWTPFKGLASFNYEDKRRFFGRDRAVEQLFQNYQDSDGLLVVTGVSGSGKSSVVKAGLIPQIEQQLSEGQKFYWHVANNKANNGIESILTELFAFLVDAWNLEEQPEYLAQQAFKQADRINITGDINKPCLLFIDQYEEVFNNSQITKEQAPNLAPILEELANKIAGLRIVISIRAEYLEIFGRYGIDTHVSQKLNPDEWKGIVEKQAAYSGLGYEDGLAKQIINDANEITHALPVVEYLLEQLYVKATEENENAKQLKQIHYEDLGGIKGVIANRAEAAISQAPELANTFFDYFIGQNSEGIAYARSVDLNSIQQEQPELYKLIQSFVDEQLVIDCSSKQQVRVKLAHDSLFFEWERLKEWILQHQDYLVWRSQIDGNFELWLQILSSSRKKSKKHIIENSALLKQARLHKKQNEMHNTDLICYINYSLRKRIIKIACVSTVFFVAFGAMTLLSMNEILKKDAAIKNVTSNYDDEKTKVMLLEFNKKYKLIEKIADDGLFAEDYIVLKHYGYVKKIIDNEAISKSQKQHALDYMKNFESDGVEAEIIFELNLKGYNADSLQVKKSPDIYRLILNAKFIEQEDKQYWFDFLSGLNSANIGKLHAHIKSIVNDDNLSEDQQRYALTFLEEFAPDGAKTKLVTELNTKGYKVDSLQVKEMPILSRLIMNAESMDQKEKQFWFYSMPRMTDEQKDRLYSILLVENIKLNYLEFKYQNEIKNLNEKHNHEWTLYTQNHELVIKYVDIVLAKNKSLSHNARSKLLYNKAVSLIALGSYIKAQNILSEIISNYEVISSGALDEYVKISETLLIAIKKDKDDSAYANTLQSLIKVYKKYIQTNYTGRDLYSENMSLYMNELTWHYLSINEPEKAFVISREALSYSRRINEPFLAYASSFLLLNSENYSISRIKEHLDSIRNSERFCLTKSTFSYPELLMPYEASKEYKNIILAITNKIISDLNKRKVSEGDPFECSKKDLVFHKQSVTELDYDQIQLLKKLNSNAANLIELSNIKLLDQLKQEGFPNQHKEQITLLRRIFENRYLSQTGKRLWFDVLNKKNKNINDNLLNYLNKNYLENIIDARESRNKAKDDIIKAIESPLNKQTDRDLRLLLTAVKNINGVAPEIAISLMEEFKEKYSKRDSDLATCYKVLAKSYAQIEKYEEAIINYKSSLELIKDEKEIYGINHNIRSLYDKQKQYLLSIDNIEKLLAANMQDSNKTARLFGALSWYYILIKQYDKAYEAAVSGLRADPSEFWIKVNLAHSLLFLGEKERAEAVFFANAYAMIGRKTFNSVVIEDFEVLNEHGITHPDLDDIKSKLLVLPKAPTSKK